MLSAQIRSDLYKLGLTFAIALGAGWLFSLLSVPAPYMMGAVFGTWAIGGSLPVLHPYLGVARWFHIPVILGLGTMIGASFDQALLAQIPAWWPTLLVMMAATLVATGVGLIYMVWVRGHDLRTSLLCCLPGGQAEIIIIANTLTDKDYVVALCHLIRVSLVVTLIPLVLALSTGFEGVQASYEVQSALPQIYELPWQIWLKFLACALAGYGVARLARLPMPHLLGPLLLSGLLHSLELIDIPRVSEFVILAQLVIGGGVGARLAKVPFKEVLVYVVDGLVNAALILASYVSMAAVVVLVFGLSFVQVLLAFIPGGLYEVTLLALIFGYDLAFVTVHHTLRILLIFFSLPALASWLKR